MPIFDDDGDRITDLPGLPRRESPRYSVRRKIELRYENWTDFLTLYTSNLSRTGFLCNVDDPPAVGEKVDVRVSGPDRTGITLTGEVVRHDPPVTADSGVGIAVRLVSAENEPLLDLLTQAHAGVRPPSPVPRAASQWRRVPDLADGGATEIDLVPELADGVEVDAASGAEEPSAESFWSDASSSVDFESGGAARQRQLAPFLEAQGSPEKPSEMAQDPEPLDISDISWVDDPAPAVAEVAPAVDGDAELLPLGMGHSEVEVGPPLTGRLEVDAEPPLPGQLEVEAEPPVAGHPEVELAPPLAVRGHEPSAHQIAARTDELPTSPGLSKKPRTPYIGIDFGTTSCKVAVVFDGEVVLIEDRDNPSATRAAVPSALGWHEDAGFVVGQKARDLLAAYPGQVVTSVKRLMGLKFEDRLASGVLGSLACPCRPDSQGTIHFTLGDTDFTVAEVAARVLRHVKKTAEAWAEGPIGGAVLTAPVDFGPEARRELELAAEMAGIKVLNIIPEPVAAAMGCGVSGAESSTIAVYDFGGGTFDASVVQVSSHQLAVRGAAGDRWLGGDDLDEALASFVADDFYRNTNVRVHGKAEQWQRLLFASEDAKRWLSTLEEVDVIVPRAAEGPAGPVTLLVPVSRAAFESACREVVQCSLDVSGQALAQAGLDPADVSHVLVTGGTSRVPFVQQAVTGLFGKTPMESMHPEHSVVMGAAVHAAALSKNQSQELPSGFGKHLRDRDSTGRSVGLALADGTTQLILTERDRPPVASHRLYSTSKDGQTQCRIEILEGQSRLSAENRRVGGFVIDGLPAAPAGAIDLDVYFELSTTAALCVTAQERSTGNKVKEIFELFGAEARHVGADADSGW